MNDYEYDNTGVSSALLAVALGIPLLGAMYPMAFRQKRARDFKCDCEGCAECKDHRVRKEPFSVYKAIFLGACLLLVIPLKTIVFHGYGQVGAFNPYEILGVGRSAKDQEIIKAYRKKVRQIKLKERSSKKGKDMLQEAIKAHGTLIDKKLRETWDAFGEAEQKKTHTIAIPEWTMSRYASLGLLGLYILGLGFALPRIVSVIWKMTAEKSSTGASYATTEGLYNEMKQFKGTRSIYVLVEWIAKSSKELKDVAEKYHIGSREGTRDLIRSVVEGEFAIKLDDALFDQSDAYAIAMGVLCIRNQEIRRELGTDLCLSAQRELINSATGIKCIAKTIEQTNTFYTALDLLRCVFQGVPGPEYWQLQYPGATLKDSLAQYAKSTGSGSRPGQAAHVNLDLTKKGTAIDFAMHGARIAGVDVYSSGNHSEMGEVSVGSDVIVRVTVIREGEKTEYTPLARKARQTALLDSGDLSVVETISDPELEPHELEKEPIFIRSRGSSALHAPFFLPDVPAYDWIMALEINSLVVTESPAFSIGKEGAVVFFKLPPIQSFYSAKISKSILSVRLLNPKFFHRDSSTAKSVSLKA